MEELKEIFQSISTRIRSPFFGYYFFSCAIINWKSWYFLLFSNDHLFLRFEYVDNTTSSYSLFWIPLIIGFILTISSPWARWFFVWALQYPTTKRNLIQAKSEYTILAEKTRRTKAIDEEMTAKEESAIAQALRDERIRSISDDETRERLQAQIDEIREQMSNQETIIDIPPEYIEAIDPELQLTISITDEGNGCNFKLNNVGGSDALNIKFRLKEYEESTDPIDLWVYDMFPIARIAPGQSVKINALLPPDVLNNRYLAEVSWETESGILISKDLVALTDSDSKS